MCCESGNKGCLPTFVIGRFGPGSFLSCVCWALGHFWLSCFVPGSFRPHLVGRFGVIYYEPSSRADLGVVWYGSMGKGTDVW